LTVNVKGLGENAADWIAIDNSMITNMPISY
jgi:hypothetical protein